jgi:Domain of unknown function (DUF4386)
MTSTRRTATVTGLFFLLAAVAAIAAKLLWIPVLSDASYVVGGGADTRVLLGVFVEFLTAVGVTGTAVALYPVLRRYGQGLTVGYLAGRLIEAVTIVVGLSTVLAVVALRQDNAGAAGADDVSLVAVQAALVAVHDAMFLLGPGLIIGINSLLLASLMYRSRLVPRWIAWIGLVGGPLVFLSSTAVLFGVYEQVSGTAGIFAFPVFIWEMSLAAYLIAKGFRTSPTVPRSPADEQPVLASA